MGWPGRFASPVPTPTLLRPDKLTAGIMGLDWPPHPAPPWKSPGAAPGEALGTGTPSPPEPPPGPPGAVPSWKPLCSEGVPALGGCSLGTRLPGGCSWGSLTPPRSPLAGQGGPAPPGAHPCDGPGTCCLPAASRRGEASGDRRKGGLTPRPWQGAAARGYRRAAQWPGPAATPRPPAANPTAQEAAGEPRPCRRSPAAAVDMQPGYAAVLCEYSRGTGWARPRAGGGSPRG